MTKKITYNVAIAATLSLFVAHPAYSAVPNTFSAGQAASAAEVNANFNNLDVRLDVLENNIDSIVNINCVGSPNALKNTTIRANTTYSISGACNGPIYVNEDHVHLLGSNNSTDSIVLPAGLDESAVWAGGAYNLQITSLFLDLTSTTAANNTAGIWARHAYVVLRDSRIQGGSSGVQPFRGAIVRLEGTNSITEFRESGLSASDQSNINTRGQTIVSSTKTNDQFMKAIRATTGSSIDIRSGITVSVPTSTDARAIHAEFNATVLIQNSGTVNLTGDILSDKNSIVGIKKGAVNGDIEVSDSSSLLLENGAVIGDIDLRSSSHLEADNETISGDLDIRRSSNVEMDDVSITGVISVTAGSALEIDDVIQASNSDSAINIERNSLLTASRSDLGRFFVFTGSVIQLNSSTVKGGEINLGSSGAISDTSSTRDIVIYPSAAIHLTGSSSLNGNNLYLCGTPSFVDSSVTGINNSGTTSNCAP